MIIYKITNLVNNKIYIGQTTGTIEKRWQRHNWQCTRKRNAMAITNAIIKYGKENFTIEEIDKAETIEELNEKEIYFISLLNSISPNGYNLSGGGGYVEMSDETKLKISNTHKRKWKEGNRISEETRKKLSDSHKGWIPSEETKEKWRKAFGGKRPSDNTIQASIESSQKTYTLLNPLGELITFTNMREFCKQNGLSNSKLCLVASGKRPSHKGWTKP
jgi:group I intron endonuclease